MLQGTGQRKPRRCDPAKLNTLAAVAALIPHHTTHSKPECGQEGRLSGRPRGKAKCIGRDQKAREHLVGHSRPRKPLPPKARATLQARGQRWPPCQPRSAQGRGGPGLRGSCRPGHLPLQCPSVSFLKLPSALAPSCHQAMFQYSLSQGQPQTWRTTQP